MQVRSDCMAAHASRRSGQPPADERQRRDRCVPAILLADTDRPIRSFACVCADAFTAIHSDEAVARLERMGRTPVTAEDDAAHAAKETMAFRQFRAQLVK